MPAKIKKRVTSFRLTQEALRLLTRISARRGIGRSAILEIAIRDAASAAGVGLVEDRRSA